MTNAVNADPSDALRELLRGRSGTLLHEEIERRWPAGHDGLGTMARYALLPPGKLLRPLMTLACAEAVGGEPAEVLPAALAMEYLHVATLTHDDIIDGDELRRFRPTVHVAYGVPEAIVTGDHLIFAAFGAIAECRPAGVTHDAIVAATAALATAGSDLCRGQIMEASLAGDPTVNLASYFTVARLKTGALFRVVCQVGALLGGAGAASARLLGEYGENLGIAFQIRDDLIACTEPPEVTGKPASSDLANGRPTLPVLFAYQAGDPDTRARLTAALTGRDRHPRALAEFRALLAGTGALAKARQTAAEYGGEALIRLSTVEDSDSVNTLATIVDWAVGTKG